MMPWRLAVRSRLARSLAVALFVTLASTGSLPAVSTVLWSQQDLADFEKGKPEGVAVTARSGIVLARAIKELSIKPLEENSQPFLWSEALDSKGNLYVGSGNEGRVFKVTRGGSGSLFYSTGDLAAQTLVVDSRDNLYVGTSPNGKVYRVSPEGKGEVWFDPDERYIWALAVDRSGRLYVATGEHGIIYKVTEKEKGTPFFDSEESHIVSLFFDRQDNLMAGSSGKGLLYRITPDGKASVLLDTAFREVNSVATDSGGRVYASAIRVEAAPGKPVRPRSQTGFAATEEEVVTVTLPGGGLPLAQAEEEPAPEGEPGAPPAVSGQRQVRSQIFRIEPDGIAKPVWGSDTETVFSLAVAGEGEVYLGTGDSGKIRHLETDGTSSLVARLASSQVTALLAGPDGSLYAAGSNTGRVYQLGAEPADSGTYVSPPQDARTVARWGQIGWRGSVPSGARVELFTRSGNSAVPDSTWSDWSVPSAAQGGSGVVSPAARFIQWKAHLSRQAKGVSPLLEAVSLSYLPANLPPKVEQIVVNAPGVVLQKSPIAPDAEGPGTAFSEVPALPEGTELPSAFPILLAKKVYQRGMRSLTWEASDENSDTLRFDLSYRGEGEKEWKPLARGLKEKYFAWDSTLLPDGRYRVKVLSTDAPSNPPGSERTAEAISPSFAVDNTPPKVEAAPPRKEEKGITLEVRVTDTTSPIRSLSFSVDASLWTVLMPVDGIADSPSEQYRLALDRLPAGEHTILLKATDAEGNVGTGKVIIPGA